MFEPTLSARQVRLLLNFLGELLGPLPAPDDDSPQADARRLDLLTRMQSALLQRPVGLTSRVPAGDRERLVLARAAIAEVGQAGTYPETLRTIVDSLDSVIAELGDAWAVDAVLPRCRSLRPATGEEEQALADLLQAGVGAGLCWGGEEEGGAA